jgi:hypothetical protein
MAGKEHFLPFAQLFFPGAFFLFAIFCHRISFVRWFSPVASCERVLY